MPSYLRCDGAASLAPSGEASCSSGWVSVAEPTFTLIPPGQTSDLIVAVLGALAILWSVKIIVQLMGFKL